MADDVRWRPRAEHGRLPQRRPGMHLGGAFLRAARGVDDFWRPSSTRPAPCGGRPLDETKTWADVFRAATGQGRAQVEPRWRGRRGGRRGDRAGQEARPTTSPLRWSPEPPPRPTCCARRPSARWRRSCQLDRSTRPSSWPTRPPSGWARTSTRATSKRRCAACARSALERSGSTTRSPTTTPGRSAASSGRASAASSVPRGSRRSRRQARTHQKRSPQYGGTLRAGA